MMFGRSSVRNIFRIFEIENSSNCTSLIQICSINLLSYRTWIPDYFDIIRNPMDFSTIKKKLNNCQYTNGREFCNDMEQVFDIV